MTDALEKWTDRWKIFCWNGIKGNPNDLPSLIRKTENSHDNSDDGNSMVHKS